MDETDIDGLLDDLHERSASINPAPINVPRDNDAFGDETPTEDEISDFVIQNAAQLVKMGIRSVAQVKDFVISGQDPEEIASLAELISATSKSIDALNKINLFKRKAAQDLKLKTLEWEQKKEIAKLLPGNITNNNVLIASREEIIKQLVDKGSGLEDEPLEIEAEQLFLRDNADK